MGKKTKRKTKRAKKTKTKTNQLNKQKKLVLELMRELKWPRTERPNVIRESHKNREGKGGYEGFALGKVTSWAGKGENAGYKQILSLKTRDKKYKGLFKETKKLMKVEKDIFKKKTFPISSSSV